MTGFEILLSLYYFGNVEEQDNYENGQVDSKELWRMAGVKNKVDTVVSLGANVRFVWILAICAFAIAALLFFLIPAPNPQIERLYINDSFVVASSGKQAIVFDDAKRGEIVELPFQPTSIAYNGNEISVASVSDGKVAVLDKQGKQMASRAIHSPYGVSYIAQSLFLVTEDDVIKFEEAKWPAPKFKRLVALLGEIIVDYGGFFKFSTFGGFDAHPFAGKPMAVCAGMKGNDIIVGFEDMTFAVYDDDGAKQSEGKMPSWVWKNYVVSGDMVACYSGSNLRIGRLEENKPLFEGDAWEGK